ncbi:hypothetical protein HDV05_002867 [Chytridiales sp. JEL 0842]|nr:hypothetical protein HDV05_002867 [Chytridiales sp. JEL 0842]
MTHAPEPPRLQRPSQTITIDIPHSDSLSPTRGSTNARPLRTPHPNALSSRSSLLTATGASASMLHLDMGAMKLRGTHAQNPTSADVKMWRAIPRAYYEILEGRDAVEPEKTLTTCAPKDRKTLKAVVEEDERLVKALRSLLNWRTYRDAYTFRKEKKRYQKETTFYGILYLAAILSVAWLWLPLDDPWNWGEPESTRKVRFELWAFVTRFIYASFGAIGFSSIIPLTLEVPLTPLLVFGWIASFVDSLVLYAIRNLHPNGPELIRNNYVVIAAASILVAGSFLCIMWVVYLLGRIWWLTRKADRTIGVEEGDEDKVLSAIDEPIKNDGKVQAPAVAATRKMSHDHEPLMISDVAEEDEDNQKIQLAKSSPMGAQDTDVSNNSKQEEHASEPPKIAEHNSDNQITFNVPAAAPPVRRKTTLFEATVVTLAFPRKPLLPSGKKQNINKKIVELEEEAPPAPIENVGIEEAPFTFWDIIYSWIFTTVNKSTKADPAYNEFTRILVVFLLSTLFSLSMDVFKWVTMKIASSLFKHGTVRTGFTRIDSIGSMLAFEVGKLLCDDIIRFLIPMSNVCFQYLRKIKFLDEQTTLLEYRRELMWQLEIRFLTSFVSILALLSALLGSRFSYNHPFLTFGSSTLPHSDFTTVVAFMCFCLLMESLRWWVFKVVTEGCCRAHSYFGQLVLRENRYALAFCMLSVVHVAHDSWIAFIKIPEVGFR